MDLEAKALIAAIGILVIIGLCGGSYMEGHKRGAMDTKAADNVAIIHAAKENQDLINKLEVQHAQANAALNVLLNAPAPRVRVPQCRSQTVTAPGSTVPATGTERTDISTQESFDRFKQALESDAAEFSRALNACQVVMDWAKAQAK